MREDPEVEEPRDARAGVPGGVVRHGRSDVCFWQESVMPSANAKHGRSEVGV